MKKVITAVLITFAMSFALYACSDPTSHTIEETVESTTIATTAEETTTEETTTASATEEETEMTEYISNRELFAEVLSLPADAGQLDRLMAALDYLETGDLQSAELVSEDDPLLYPNNYFLYFVAEDGTNYRMIITEHFSIEAVQNVDTGEWVMTSYR